MSEITPFENNRQALNEFYRGTTLYRIPEKQEGSSIALEGANKKAIILVLPQSISAFESGTREMLSKMLSAQGLSFDDIGIAVKKDSDNWSAHDLIQSHKPAAVLFYGVDPLKLGLALSLYDFYHDGNVKMLYADALDRLVADPALKAKLWNVLKQHFIYK